MSDSASVSQDTDSSKGSSRLKKLTSSSTWTSPFRASGSRKNIIKEFKDNNSVSQLHVPKKFTQHPNLDKGVEAKPKTAQNGEKKAESKAEKKTEDKDKSVIAADPAVDGLPDAAPDVTSVEAVKTEAVATPDAALDDERPLTEAEQAESKLDAKVSSTAPEAKTSKDAEKPVATEEPEEVPVVNENVGDDNIVQQVKEVPIELDIEPESKYLPVEAPNQKVLDSFADKPNLLNRYQELNGAITAQNATSLDGPDKVIDLGSGLRLTQQQLLDIAAKRVAPVIANINEEVEKTQKEDKIVEKKELDATVAKHNVKLNKDFEKHAAKVAKSKEKFDKEIAAKLASLEKESASSTAAAEEFDKKTTQEIATANENYMERERKAMEQHEIDKETLLKNHDELEATKKQELEDSKAKQITTTEEIEALQETKGDLDNTNTELSDDIERLTQELAQREEELTAIAGKLTTEKDAFNKNEETKKDLHEKVVVAEKGVEEKKESKSKLAVEVGLLGSAVAAYAAKLTSLKSDNEKQPERIAVAKEKYNAWDTEKREMAEKVAREHEQQRLEAREAAATEKIKAEIEEEKQRLEKEKQQYLEERERLEKEEQERKEQKEKEEQERLAAEEQARKEAEEKAAQEKKEAEEKAAQKAAQEKKEAEERAAQEEKEAEEKAKKDAEEKAEREAAAERLAAAQAAVVAEEKKAAEAKAAREKLEAEEKDAAEAKAAREQKEAEERKVAEAAKERKEAEDKKAAEAKAAREQKEAEERKAAEAKAAKEQREAEEKKLAVEKAANEKKLAAEQKAKEVNTYHHSKEPETTVVGYGLSEANGNGSKSVNGSEPSAVHNKGAVPVVAGNNKSAASDETESGERENNHKTLATLGAGAGAGALTGAGISAIPHGSTEKSSNSGNVERHRSFSKKLKSVFGKKDKDEDSDGASTSSKNKSATPQTKAVTAKQPYGKTGAASTDDLVSIYEEVSDREYEQHKNDPDYIEVDAAKAAELLRRHKELLPQLKKVSS